MVGRCTRSTIIDRKWSTHAEKKTVNTNEKKTKCNRKKRTQKALMIDHWASSRCSGRAVLSSRLLCAASSPQMCVCIGFCFARDSLGVFTCLFSVFACLFFFSILLVLF